MKNTLVKIIATAATAAAIMAMAGCSAKSAAGKGNTASGNTIKIGMNMELSGAAAGYGNQMKQGFDLAVKQINADGGIKVGDKKMKIKTVVQDNKSTTSGSASVAAQLATKDKVTAIVGPATTNDGTAAIPNITKAAVPSVSPSATDPDYTLQKNGKVQTYVFRACFNNDLQGETAAHFANKTLKAKNVAILADNSSDYGTGLAKAFKKAYTGTIKSTQYFSEGDKDFNALITSIKNKKVDAIYAPGYYSELGLIIKQARQSGVNVPIIGSDGMADPKLAQIASNSNATNVYYTTPFSTKAGDTNAVAKQFMTDFKQEYKEDAPTFSALAYDSVLMIKQAIEDSKSTNSVKVAKALAKIKDMPAVTGKTSVDKNHDPEKPIVVEQLTNGKVTSATAVK
ncbi:ABC transporter substrate-binding protein [Lacticaseibacillus baoqingensis]|uniref:ABC transporter substrate-binding protein n=1 Tax=Lacticaseibacillus baoqingensis TaxID=2486013 RepID=A0ABW4EAG3_9LACO|nr:ABC transporter substrate-binding protein [Lacticaseibacillus baoqingensis]